jgi:kumamolisin
VTSARKFHAITGSERQPVRGARLIRNSHPDQIVEVSIRLRPKSEAKNRELRSVLEKPGFKQMSRAEFENAHGADPADLDKIRKFAKEFGLNLGETGTELARRTVVLSGTVSDLQKSVQRRTEGVQPSEGKFPRPCRRPQCAG